MIVRLTCFIGVFIVLINKVSPQVTVEGVICDSVILPCSSAEPPLKQDINVHWRHNSKIMYDIIKGKGTVEFQDQQYKNRTETFPDEYLRGNFSIKLNYLNLTDAGKYICLISHSSKLKNVQLIINESKPEKNGCEFEIDQPISEPGDGGRTSVLMILVYVLLALLSIALTAFLIRCHKKRACSFSSVKTEDTVISDT